MDRDVSAWAGFVTQPLVIGYFEEKTHENLMELQEHV
jgi:hypothetical protein